MYDTNKRKREVLGMNPSTARHRLVKSLLFQMAKRHSETRCFQCGEEIESENDFTIEHKTPWLNSDDPLGLYFDLENVTFSHHSCNSSAAKPWKQKDCPEGTNWCPDCETYKPLEEFWKTKGKRNGVESCCKKHSRLRDKKRRKNHGVVV